MDATVALLINALSGKQCISAIEEYNLGYITCPSSFPDQMKSRALLSLVIGLTYTVSSLQIADHGRLCENNTTLRHLIEMRNPYIDPINILQVEILRRLRQDPENSQLKEALMITMHGIAAGMKNSG